MKKVTINLYCFDELNEAAKQTAINAHRNFELSVMCPDDFSSKYLYNSEYNYYLNDDSPIIEAIEANEYLFFANGEIANCTTYSGSHPKSGMTEFSIGGDIYCLI